MDIALAKHYCRSSDSDLNNTESYLDEVYVIYSIRRRKESNTLNPSTSSFCIDRLQPFTYPLNLRSIVIALESRSQGVNWSPFHPGRQDQGL